MVGHSRSDPPRPRLAFRAAALCFIQLNETGRTSPTRQITLSVGNRMLTRLPFLISLPSMSIGQPCNESAVRSLLDTFFLSVKHENDAAAGGPVDLCFVCEEFQVLAETLEVDALIGNLELLGYANHFAILAAALPYLIDFYAGQGRRRIVVKFRDVLCCAVCVEELPGVNKGQFCQLRKHSIGSDLELFADVLSLIGQVLPQP